MGDADAKRLARNRAAHRAPVLPPAVLDGSLPMPHAVGDRGQLVWQSGVTVEGFQLRIPGRALDSGQLEEAEAHARSVLAAVEVMRAEPDPELTSDVGTVVSSHTT